MRRSKKSQRLLGERRMVPNWLRVAALSACLVCLSTGCMTGRGHRATLTLGPEGASAPVQELPPKDSAYVCLVTGYEFEKVGRVPEAICLYEKARTVQPSLDKKLTRRLAVLYDQMGNFAKADEEFAKALANQPRDAGLLNDLGYSHYARGNWAEAEEYLNQAVALNPDHKRAWINLGMVIAQQGRYPESMRAFRNATSEAEALCNLGFVLSVQGKKDEALQAYSRAVELAPSLKLAQAAVNRYTAPETARNDKTEKIVKEPPLTPKSASPYGAVTAPPARLPASTRVVDETPIIIDPNFDELPKAPALPRP